MTGNADALEAQAFAFLAARSMRGLPITFPTTSGAPKPMQGGVFARP
jgi:anhydro-N-acetylmuramic acid kinase